jgi:hypothetical protein
MAEIAYTLTTTDKGDALIVWPSVTEADTFQMYELDSAVSEISVHIKGTFGGATVIVTGSNHAGNTGPTLEQIGNSAASTTTEDLFSILDRPLEITPSASSGSSQSVSIYMMVRN